MSDADNAAFPIGDNIRYNPQYGLTKREYFAALAMQGLGASRIGSEEWNAELIATYSVELADALLKRLAK